MTTQQRYAVFGSVVAVIGNGALTYALTGRSDFAFIVGVGGQMLVVCFGVIVGFGIPEKLRAVFFGSDDDDLEPIEAIPPPLEMDAVFEGDEPVLLTVRSDIDEDHVCLALDYASQGLADEDRISGTRDNEVLIETLRTVMLLRSDASGRVYSTPFEASLHTKGTNPTGGPSGVPSESGFAGRPESKGAGGPPSTGNR